MYVRYFAILGFILFGAMSRFLPHPPNFTAMNAIALFSAYSIGSLPLSIVTVFTSMLMADFVIGFHSIMLYVYLSFALIVSLGHFLKQTTSTLKLSLISTTSSILFFIVTNFGVWLTSSMYSKTIEGLMTCYIAAVPFISNQVFGDIFYTILLVKGWQFLENKLLRNSIHTKLEA